MSSSITYAGEALIARLQAEGTPLVIDKIIFADVQGLDPTQAVDRSQPLPQADVVFSYDIPPEFKAFVSPNMVVYSALLGSDVGDFDFNWQGLYCSEHDTLVAAAWLPTLSKRRTDQATGQAGNNLSRNFMLQFSGAADLTGITVEAATWQIDFTVRLKGIDERERLSNRDIYGRAAFPDDGWLLVNDAGNYSFQAGHGYVEGIRAALPALLPVVPPQLPCDVWLDVCMEPQGSDVVATATPVFVAPGADVPDYTEDAPFNTPHSCVQVASVAEDGTVTDLRPKTIALSAEQVGAVTQEQLAAALAAMDTTKSMRDMLGGSIVEWEAEAIPTLSDGLPLGLELNGDVVDLNMFPRLLRKWPGQEANSTCPAWYRCTSGGTRDPAGGYIRLQDRRGQFPRGWDHGRGVDSGRVLGSAQADDLKSHTHSVRVPAAGGSAAGGNVSGSYGIFVDSSATGGSETRPRNCATMYLIYV
ncbi:Protein of unknown function DUF3751, tail fiber protein [Desulfovibrio sp. X2]|uniref:phage tail protein n=1 Tax=Desulfovibrio sp. X2 TaxID=941449 RepID=UPI000358D8A8|nr:phage tail protein [Desulfovibrio sp. X2]EPR43146.1 Protein of unknown function DUF3751, tail fiber protein [Desulfovibrio sp. X2]